MTYEGTEGGETGEQQYDDEERQEPMLKKWKYDKYFFSKFYFAWIFKNNCFCLGGGTGFKYEKQTWNINKIFLQLWASPFPQI